MVERLNKTLLYTYGIADLGFVVMVSMELYLFSAFLTDYAEFSVPMTSFILVFTSLADIACALAAGMVLQKVTLNYGGKYRSWFLVGPPAVAVLFILQFSKIGPDLMAALIVIFGFVASHIIWNVVFTASASMVGRLSQSQEDRTILSTSRAQGMSAASIIFAVTHAGILGFFTLWTNSVIAFSLTTGVYVIFMMLGYWYLYKMTAGKDPYDEAIPDPAPKAPRQSMMAIVLLVFKNPPLLMLIFAEIFRNTYILIIGSFAFYYFRYVLNNDSFFQHFILAIGIARLIGTFAASWIGVKIGKRNTYWISLLLTAIVFISAKFFGETAWGFTVIYCIGSSIGMVASAMATALFSDTVVYGEWKTGKNIRAFTMALMTFPIKVGIFIRSGVFTLGFTAIGFVANAVPTPEVVAGISAIMIYIPVAVCVISAALFYFGYRIEDKQVVRMEKEIAARKV